MTQVTQIWPVDRNLEKWASSRRFESLDREQIWVGKVLLLSWMMLQYRLPFGYTHTSVMRMFQTLGLHGTLEIGKEKDWTVNAPALSEHGMKNSSVPICSCIYSHSHFFFLYFDSFFFLFVLKMHFHTQICCSYTKFKSCSGTWFTPFHLWNFYSRICSLLLDLFILFFIFLV